MKCIYIAQFISTSVWLNENLQIRSNNVYDFYKSMNNIFFD